MRGFSRFPANGLYDEGTFVIDSSAEMIDGYRRQYAQIRGYIKTKNYIFISKSSCSAVKLGFKYRSPFFKT